LNESALSLFICKETIVFEFWAVIGRMCLDPDFHKELYDRSDPHDPSEDLTKLQTFLCVQEELPLGRWELGEINRVVSGNYGGKSFTPHEGADDDQQVRDIRAGLTLTPLPFAENLSFCAAFGLTCVDFAFRKIVAGSSSDDEVRRQLSVASETHPKMLLTPGEVHRLREVAIQKLGQISTFHSANWIIPERTACSGGYSITAPVPYFHTPQTDLIALVRNDHDLFDTVFNHGVARGDRAAFKEAILAIH
jgi:hypothetical protein